MLEYFLYIAFPVLMALFYLQKRFFHSWRFLLVSSLAIYLGLWTFPAFYELTKPLFPREMEVYSKLCVQSGIIVLFFLSIFQISAIISTHSGGGYHLPRGRAFRNLPTCGLIGLLYSGLIGYLLCLSPLHCKLATTDSFAAKAVRRMQVFTVIIDRLSLQSATMAQRKQELEKRIYPRIDPREIKAKEIAEKRAAKEAAVKREAEERARAQAEAEEAARKAAEEKARQEAIEKERNRGRIIDASGVWRKQDGHITVTQEQQTEQTAPKSGSKAPVKKHNRGRIIDASGNWGSQDSNVPEQQNSYRSEPSHENGSMNNNNDSLPSGEIPAGTAAGMQGENTAL